MMFGFIEAALSILIIVVFVVSYISRKRVRHIRKARLLKEEFFRSAKILIEDKEVPLILIGVIDFMAHNINSLRLAHRFAKRLIYGNVRDAVRNPNENQLRLTQAVASLPSELYQHFIGAASAFVLATTYRTFLFGSFLRCVLVIWADTQHDDTSLVLSSEGDVHISESNVRAMVANVACS